MRQNVDAGLFTVLSCQLSSHRLIMRYDSMVNYVPLSSKYIYLLKRGLIGRWSRLRQHPPLVIDHWRYNLGSIKAL